MSFINLPPDPTPEEIRILATGKSLIYRQLPTDTDRFIVAYVFDMGFTREETALAMGVSYKTVWSRIRKIKNHLAKYYGYDPEKYPIKPAPREGFGQ